MRRGCCLTWERHHLWALTILHVRNWFQKEAPSSKLKRTPPGTQWPSLKCLPRHREPCTQSPSHPDPRYQAHMRGSHGAFQEAPHILTTTQHRSLKHQSYSTKLSRHRQAGFPTQAVTCQPGRASAHPQGPQTQQTLQPQLLPRQSPASPCLCGSTQRSAGGQNGREQGIRQLPQGHFSERDRKGGGGRRGSL